MSSEDQNDSGVAGEKSLAHRKSDGDDGSIDLEATKKHIPYPKSVIFIVVCEFCERFNYYGMRAILTLYFKNILKWDEDFATVIYHLFTMFCYFTPLIGAMLADSLLGKFRTIFYLAVVYACGSVVLTLAATEPLSIPQVPFSMIGLALIAVGTGGIKPCVAAFGGDQFIIPGQESQLESYFAIFYFAINGGSLISTTVTPIFREDVHCFGDDHCYPLAFSVPAALMIVALIIFVVGRPFYTVNKPQGNVVLQVLSAIRHSFRRKKEEIQAGRTREHWIDYADDKFDKKFLEDTKAVLKVLFLYLPLPLFWALFDQQGSRWTFQATRMDGLTFGYLIKPDQMQVVNPLLVLAFIPIFDRVFYPLLAKCNLLKRPLQRLTVGGAFAGIAFAVSGIVELQLQKTYAVELESGEASLHFVNVAPCPLKVELRGVANYDIGSIGSNEIHLLDSIQHANYMATISFLPGGTCGTNTLTKPVFTTEEKAFAYMIYQQNDGSLQMARTAFDNHLEKSEEGDPLVRFIYLEQEDNFNSDWNYVSVKLVGEDRSFFFSAEKAKQRNETADTDHEESEIEPETYSLELGFWDDLTNKETTDPKRNVVFETEYKFELGGNYLVTVLKKDNGDTVENHVVNVHTITEPNSIHMLWLLPQYVIMTMGEIMFSITIMDFSYAEAPISMKSVMQSAWLMTVAFGNLIVVIIAEAKIFNKQWKEFFLFAGLMFADMILFSYMAYLYVPNKKPTADESVEDEKKEAIEGKETGDSDD